MPLFKIIRVKKGITIWIWKVKESESDLRQIAQLSEHCKYRLVNQKSEWHRKGFLSIRCLLQKAGYTAEELCYDEKGKPYLKDGKHISITHSYIFSGIIISDSISVGIDIEKKRENILKIAPKFTSLKTKDVDTDKSLLIQKLTIIWAAKESLYKIFSPPGLFFLKHIFIEDFNIQDKKTMGRISYKGTSSAYTVFFEVLETFICAYALPK